MVHILICTQLSLLRSYLYAVFTEVWTTIWYWNRVGAYRNAQSYDTKKGYQTLHNSRDQVIGLWYDDLDTTMIAYKDLDRYNSALLLWFCEGATRC